MHTGLFALVVDGVEKGGLGGQTYGTEAVTRVAGSGGISAGERRSERGNGGFGIRCQTVGRVDAVRLVL